MRGMLAGVLLRWWIITHFFPAEDVDGKVVLFFHFYNLRDGCWGVNNLEVEVAQGRILAWPFNMVCSRIES